MEIGQDLERWAREREGIETTEEQPKVVPNLQREGYVKFIGVTVTPPTILRRILI